MRSFIDTLIRSNPRNECWCIERISSHLPSLRALLDAKKQRSCRHPLSASSSSSSSANNPLLTHTLSDQVSNLTVVGDQSSSSPPLPQPEALPPSTSISPSTLEVTDEMSGEQLTFTHSSITTTTTRMFIISLRTNLSHRWTTPSLRTTLASITIIIIITIVHPHCLV